MMMATSVKVTVLCDVSGIKNLGKSNFEVALNGPIINILGGECIVISFQQNCLKKAGMAKPR